MEIYYNNIFIIKIETKGKNLINLIKLLKYI